MNSVGQSGDKKSYRVILLLVVGLTAFSSAMKELNQIREFTRDASNLVASWSHTVQPTGPVERLAPVEIPRTAVRLEVCESNPVKAVEPIESIEPLQAGGVAPEPRVEIKDVGKTFVSRRSERREEQVATLRKNRLEDIEMIELRKQVRRLSDLRITIVTDDEGETQIAIPAGLEMKLPKVKTNQQFIVNPRERDAILKNLHRSINLRSAG